MSNTITPNMGMTNPTPQSEPGPLYATEISGDINILDAHDHTPGKGALITPAGMDITSDLTFQGNNATNERSTRYTVNNTTLGGVGDLNCVYDVNGDLWFNNGSGTPIQITAGSIVNTAGPTIYSTLNVSGNVAINSADPYVMIGVNTSVSPVTVTLPLASSIPKGRLYIVKDATGTSATNNITINTSGGNTLDGASSLTMADNYWSVGFVSDGLTNYRLLKWNKFTYLSGETLTFNSGSTIAGFPTTGTSSLLSLGGRTQVTGTLSYSCVLVQGSNSPYTISTALPLTSAAICFIVSTSGPRTINLPPTFSTGSITPGGVIIIKDVTGSAATNNITVVPHAGDNIENLSSNYLIQSNYGQITLISLFPTVQGWALI